MDNYKNKEIVWEEVVDGYKAKEINIKVNWTVVMKNKMDSFEGLGGLVFSSLALRLLLTLFGIYYIFSVWYVGIFLLVYGVISGNSIQNNAVSHIINRAIQDKKYFNLMIKKEVIKILENK